MEPGSDQILPYCTTWYWVYYSCNSSGCWETGRSYAGCW
jgi:hypothetical protein